MRASDAVYPRKTINRWCAAALIAVALGCSALKIDPKVDALGRQTIALLESGDFTSLMPIMDPSLTSYSAWEQMMVVRDTLRSVKRDSTAPIGWNIFESPETYRANVTYQLHGQGWALITINVMRHEGRLVVAGIHVSRNDSSLAQMNAFHFGGKPPVQYFVFFAAMLSAIISIVAAVVVGRTRMPKRWLWTFVALIGVGRLALNWTTGETAYSSVQFVLFGAGFLRVGFTGPWIIHLSLPAGAAYALWRRHSFLNPPPDPEDAITAVTTGLIS
ncbi:MAG: hypothetical protein ABI446_08730 [Gemmatimonadaceae bacterium]